MWLTCASLLLGARAALAGAAAPSSPTTASPIPRTVRLTTLSPHCQPTLGDATPARPRGSPRPGPHADETAPGPCRAPARSERVGVMTSAGAPPSAPSDGAGPPSAAASAFADALTG